MNSIWPFDYWGKVEVRPYLIKRNGGRIDLHKRP